MLTIGTGVFLVAGSTFLKTCGSTRVFEAKEHPLLKKDFALIALDGGSGERPANSFEAFDHAAAQEAWLHVSVRLTKDNQIVASKSDRVATGEFIRDLSLEEVRAKTETHVPTLMEVTKKYQKSPVWAEMLDNSLPAAVDLVEKVQRAGISDRFVFSSPQMPPLVEFRNMRPQWLTASPVDEAERIAMLATLGLESVGGIKGDFFIAPLEREKIHILTEPLVREAHKRFKKVVAWNVNDEASLTRALELKVDGVATENPELLRGIMRSRSHP